MRAVFFDRDNTLTYDAGYCHKVSDFAWLDGALAALQRLTRHNIPIFIVTNQGGIGKGLFTLEDMTAFHNHLCEQAKAHGAVITDIAFCPHHPDAIDPAMRQCDCRKPQPAMLFALAQKWHITLADSVMIGDRPSDCEAGKAAGMTSYLSHPEENLDKLVKTVIETHFNEQTQR